MPYASLSYMMVTSVCSSREWTHSTVLYGSTLWQVAGYKPEHQLIMTRQEAALRQQRSPKPVPHKIGSSRHSGGPTTAVATCGQAQT